jgi:acetyl-CoA carboxylase biotin carboxylase subunit
MRYPSKILIANRGEIAIRVINTCKKLGIGSVAVFSDADRNALFASLADEAICIGGYNPGESYLDMGKIIEAAKLTGAEAIHPGYGFLSENEDFARLCAENGIVFIGPHADAIEALGSKIRAKEIVSGNGVPVIPGYKGEDQSDERLAKEAIAIGFPVLLKASAGGGGKGMRIVREESQLVDAIASAKRESASAFGDATMLIEKYFDSARHVEFQIFGDNHGNYIHLFERECSIQRRYQKIFEESPSPVLTPELRAEMAKAAVNAAEAVKYNNAGTVEFIVAPDGSFYFLEVNTRLQVEHPVTEMVTGLDLVKLQIEVAFGAPLSVKQEDVKQVGHALECRIYAEDPANNFLPVSGKIGVWQPPFEEGVRVDGGIQSGSVIDIYYDPMIAKVITWGENRVQSIQRMQNALGDTALLGLTTNVDFLKKILANDDFKAGNFDTHFLDKNFTYDNTISTETIDFSLIAGTLADWAAREQQRELLAEVPSGWRSNPYMAQFTEFATSGENYKVEYTYKHGSFNIQIGERLFEASILEMGGDEIVCLIGNRRLKFVLYGTETDLFIHNKQLGDVRLKRIARFADGEDEEVAGGYKAPMPGEVLKVLVEPGQKVSKGDKLLIMVSMKMENTIEAFEDGTVEEIYVADKQFVEADTLLVKIS